MNAQPLDPHLVSWLICGDEATRLRAALAIGANPEPGLIDTLIAQCATEPNFYVRDMLTWALTRYPADVTVPRVLGELRSERAQARAALSSPSEKTSSGESSNWRWEAATRWYVRMPALLTGCCKIRAQV
jgi:hypothetical protein